jgi:hypothetical protein
MLHGLLAESSSFNDSLIAAAAILGAAYLIMRSAKNKKKDPLAGENNRMTLAQQRSTERQMQSLLVELSEMARQITAQLDTRSTKLELLIREADEKLAALNDANNRHPSRPTFPIPDDEDVPPPIRLHPEKPAAPDPRYAEVYALADQGLPVPQIASRLGRPTGEVELILALRQKRSTS